MMKLKIILYIPVEIILLKNKLIKMNNSFIIYMISYINKAFNMLS